LRQRVERIGPLGAAEGARIMQEVAWALAHAHENGIVHRDVKPDNVLIERDRGRVLVTDFGIAHLARGEEITDVGDFIGTPSFASPEQANGTAVDGRSDIYSLGATMFFALTGRPVFDGQSAQAVLVKHLTEPAPPVGSTRADLPRELSQAVDRCLAKETEHRFSSAEELAVALGAARAAAPEMPRALMRLAHEADRLAVDLATAVGMAFSAVVVDVLGPQGSEMFADLVGVYLLVALSFAGALVIARLGEYVFDTRITLLGGYDERHIRQALLGSKSHPFGHPGPRKLSPRRLVYFGSTSAATLTCWWFTWGDSRYPLPSLEGLIGWVSIAGPIVMARSAAILLVARRGRTAKLWRAVLAGRVGHWLLELAALRLPKRPRAPRAEPTEVLLQRAAASIFARLPQDCRDLLQELPALVDRLENHAVALRARQAELQGMLTQISARPLEIPAVQDDSGVFAELRDRAVAAHEAFDRAHRESTARLAAVLAALETIRLDLLRLQAGLANPADLRADLDLAGQLAEEVDTLLKGTQLHVATRLPS